MALSCAPDKRRIADPTDFSVQFRGMFTLTKHTHDIDSIRQAGEGVAAQSVAALPIIEITSEMIAAAAQILEASSFCEMSPGIAEDVAEEILLKALYVGHGQQ